MRSSRTICVCQVMVATALALAGGCRRAALAPADAQARAAEPRPAIRQDSPPDYGTRLPRIVEEQPSLYEFKRADLEKIREAVFRYQFASETARLSPKVKAQVYYCIRIGDGTVDPEEGLMQRFARLDPPVRCCRECEEDLPAIRFWISRVRGLSRHKAEVEGATSRGPLDGHGEIFDVERIRGTWQVLRARQVWIS
jgi:hypothetical protein